MKRIAIHLSISLLTFACGFSVASVWNQRNTGHSNVSVSSITPESSTIPVPTETPDREVVFGQGRLRIVDEEVRLKSERLQYEIDVTFPQIKDPESWNITRNGLRFTFDHCKFFACSEGSKAVEIPFAALKEILKTEFKF